jgi:hypothetical protein
LSKYSPERYKRIGINIKIDDWKIISERIKIAKMKPTTFIREMALKSEIKIYDDNQLYQLFMQLRRIGTNINQIVHLANEVHSVNETDIENLEKRMKEIEEAVADWCKPLKYEVR